MRINLFVGHNVGISAPHLLPANAPHVKNCTNLIAGSGNGSINSVGVGVGSRLPQGKTNEKINVFAIVLIYKNQLML